jgi:hypothetical protein
VKEDSSTPKPITVIQGKPIENALRRAVRHALLEHKRAGNPIATWINGQVILIPPDQIKVEDSDDAQQK